MLRVWRVSGEELATIPAEIAEELGSIWALKHRLRIKNGLPVCLQQLVHMHNGCRLDDAAKPRAPMDMQLVLLSQARGFDASRELLEAAGTLGQNEHCNPY